MSPTGPGSTPGLREKARISVISSTSARTMREAIRIGGGGEGKPWGSGDGTENIALGISRFTFKPPHVKHSFHIRISNLRILLFFIINITALR